jgi:transcriptional regulator with GAF, ATPase, and Fis domain
MRKLYKLIGRVAATDSTVLIQGESGTGKELIARAIHQASPRKDKALVPVNCGAIPEDLLESELFGHERGAFTGAVHKRTGRFELANQGIIFLDEIGDMSPKLQVKMLRVLQERIIEPVGATRSLKVDVQVITATHKNLEKEVQSNRFREDLFYRLNVVPLYVPPLRERSEDIPLLVEHFLDKMVRQRLRTRVIIPDEVMQILMAYTWPGNIRELENTIDRITILSDDVVAVDDLPERLQNNNGLTISDDSDVIPAQAFAVNIKNGDEVDFNAQVEAFENQLILSALDQTNWNKNKAARILKLNRTTLVEKIKKKGLEQQRQM